MQNHDAIEGISQQSVHLLTTNLFHITQASFLLLNYYNPSSNLMTSRCNSTSNLMTSRCNPISNLMTSRCDPTSNLMTSRCNRSVIWWVHGAQSVTSILCSIGSNFSWYIPVMLRYYLSNTYGQSYIIHDIMVFKSFIY